MSKKPSKWKRLSDKELLKLLQCGKYSTCPIEGKVFNHRGKELKPFKGRKGEHLFVVLFFNGNYRRGISLGRLIWMDATNSIIPKNWQVHHRDEDPANNAFDNLLCLHPIDHQKLHNSNCDDVPF